MALDSQLNISREMPHFTNKSKAVAEDWPIDSVCRWLDREGWSNVVPIFREYDIHSQRFLDLSIATLDKLIPKTLLTFGDIRRLAQSVQSVKYNGPPAFQNANPGGTVSGRYVTATLVPSGAPVSVPTHITPTDTDYNKVAPYIPKRTSSNKQDITKILESLNYDVPQLRQFGTAARGRHVNNGNASNLKSSVPIRPGLPQQMLSSEKLQSPISPLSSSTGDPENRWKIGGLRAQQVQERNNQPIQEHRIQATTDADTFYGLKLADASNAHGIKKAILEKVGLSGDYWSFVYFHENGSRPDSPLTDEELVNVCRSSDNNRTNRIMVRPTLNEYLLSPEKTTSPLNMEYQRPGYYHNGSYQQLPNCQYPTSKAQPSQTSWTTSADNNDPLSVNLTHSTGNKNRPIEPTQRHHADVQVYPTPDSHNDICSPQNENTKDISYFERDFSTPTGNYAFRGPPAEKAQTSIPHSELWAVPPRAPHSQPSQSYSPTSTTEQVHVSHFFGTTPLPSICPPSDTQPQSTSGSNKLEISMWAIPPTPDTSIHSMKGSAANSPVQIAPPTAAPLPSLWAVPPTQTNLVTESPVKTVQPTPVIATSPSLWAVPPTQTNLAIQSPIKAVQSTTVVTASPSLWAVPPKSATTTPTTTKSPFANYALESTKQPKAPPSASLWAVPPSRSNTPLSVNGALSSACSEEQGDRHSLNETSKKCTPTGVEKAFQGVSLHDEAVTLSQTQKFACSPSKSASELDPRPTSRGSPNPLSPHDNNASRSPQSALTETINLDGEDSVWGERPSIEKLYRDIDKYLPGHDLDTEIIVDLPSTSTPVPRRNLDHRTSVRDVAKEAHHNWKMAMNMIRANKVLRRKSTKMWGRTVEQVKPGAIKNTSPITNQVQPALDHPNDKPVPTKMHWMRGELIGKGSFGRVYHALNIAAGEWIAVKQVDLPTTKSDMLNEQLRDRADSLYREIHLLADLDHENIVQYLGYDADQEGGQIYIFLEYIPGGSIASCLSKNGPFDEPLVKFFTRQILLGLEYLHFRNILHRDIKAGNILVDQNGCCKITDFGLSKINGEDQVYDPNSSNSLMRGTVFWMAPEVVMGCYGAKIDIWSVGCTVIEMLTGSHPWLDLNMLAALYNLGKHKAPPLPDGISESAKDFLNQCFIINPDDRPTAADLLVHPFVRQDSSFKFKEHMDYMRLERNASQKSTHV